MQNSSAFKNPKARGGFSMSNLKGICVLDSKKYILKNFGPAGDEKVKAALSEEDLKNIYSNTLMPISRVDIGLAVRHLQTIDKTLGKGDEHHPISRFAGHAWYLWPACATRRPRLSIPAHLRAHSF
jgi:hypothetical protein